MHTSDFLNYLSVVYSCTIFGNSSARYVTFDTYANNMPWRATSCWGLHEYCSPPRSCDISIIFVFAHFDVMDCTLGMQMGSSKFCAIALISTVVATSIQLATLAVAPHFRTVRPGPYAFIFTFMVQYYRKCFSAQCMFFFF